MQKKAEQTAEELRKKEQEDKDREIVEQDIAQDNLVEPLTTSSSTLTGGHPPLANLGLVPFTSSKHHGVACVDTIFFNPKKKSIVRRSKNRLKVSSQLHVVTVTEKIVDVFVTLECIHLCILCCFLLYPDVPIRRIINIINSCKFIEVNTPFVDTWRKSPKLRGTKVIILS